MPKPIWLRVAAGVILATLLAACAGQTTSTVEQPLVEEPAMIIQPPQTEPAAPEDTAPAQAGEPTRVFTPTVVKTETLGQADAADLPPEGSILAVGVVSGLNRPVGFAAANDGSGRIFILEQPGVIRTVQNGQLLPDAFMDLRDRVGSGGNEQGLLGMAVEPDFSENGRFYLNYTDQNGDTVIARYQTGSDGQQGDPGSEQVLIAVDQPFANHNGGGVVFGPDGYLYLSLGDGGSGGDPQGNAQNPDSLLGKILRIDVIGQEEYSIPDDNPFAAGGGAAEVYAWGLRNPWRFSFDRQTGDLFIADVGQSAWEEIDFYPAGGQPGPNFGWDYYEGSHPYEGQPPAGLSLEMPVFEYDHDSGCSVTGGHVYRGPAIPAMRGVYLFTDYCSGNVRGLLRVGGEWQAGVLLQFEGRFSAFGEDEAGEIYMLEHRRGILYRLEPSG